MWVQIPTEQVVQVRLFIVRNEEVLAMDHRPRAGCSPVPLVNR